MSTTEIATPSAQPAERVSLARYHLIVLAFFLLSWLAQYVALAKYLPYIPEKVRGLIQAVFLTFFAVNSGFYLSLIPLGMVFIFCWLYLMNIQVDLRKLYQIVVISILPLLLLMLGLLLQALFMKVNVSMAERLRDIFGTMLENPQQTVSHPAIKAQMDEIIKARQQEFSGVGYFSLAAAALSCLVCGHLLYKRLKLAAWRAVLIPVSFAVSIALVRALTTSGSSNLMERIKSMAQP
ncbi:MAG: hypothetical protein HY314_13110 [Acidobacteria bacterium]|nr:hypothetical protein [Acidobacteriota bacterium]